MIELVIALTLMLFASLVIPALIVRLITETIKRRS